MRCPWHCVPDRSRRLKAQPSSPPSAGARFEDSTNELSVAVGKAVLVDCAQPIQRVAVGQGEIAEASAISPTEIMINGKAEGETSLIIWDIHGGRQFFNVTVRANGAVSGDNLDTVRRELKTELPGQDVRLSYRQQQHLSARHGQGSDQFGARGCKLHRPRGKW